MSVEATLISPSELVCTHEMSSNSEPSAMFLQELCRQPLGIAHAVSVYPQQPELDADQRNNVNADLLMTYRELTQLTHNVAQTGLSVRAFQRESIGEEWPVIDPRAREMVNSPLATAWISNLLSAVVPGLVAGGIHDDSVPTPRAGV
jgi:hypothetical protein